MPLGEPRRAATKYQNRLFAVTHEDHIFHVDFREGRAICEHRTCSISLWIARIGAERRSALSRTVPR